MERTVNLKKKIAIAVLVLIGIITTIKLAIIYHEANFNPYALPSFCTINEFVDCDGVAKTSESQFLGVPLAYWGLFLYSFIFLLLFVDKLKNVKFLKFLEVFKNPLDYIASLGVISFTISMGLLCISLFEIHKLCILCAATYTLNLIIGIVAADFKNGGFIKAFKQSFIDFFDAVKQKKYLVSFIVVMLLASAGLAYTRLTYKFAPQVKRADEFSEFVKPKHNRYKVSGNLLGDEDAKVVMYVYSDYQCPMCRAHNIMIHKIAKELKDIKIIHKNLPLDMECNVYLTQPFHEGSCMEARYALAAKKQGKYWDMNSALFEELPKTEQEVLKIAHKLGLNISQLEEDANSVEIANELRKQIDEANSNGINGTPTSVVDGDINVGIQRYDDYKAWLIKKGAKER